MTLTCAGRSRTAGLGCHQNAVWAITSATRITWTGACHHHIHQILKRLADEAALEVVRADRLRNGTARVSLPRLLRAAITHRRGDWTWARANRALYEMGYREANENCRQMLAALEGDGFLVKVGGTVRVPVYRQCDDPEWATLGRALTLLLAIREEPGRWTVQRALDAFREFNPDDATTTPEQVQRDLERLAEQGCLFRIAHDTWTLPVIVPEAGPSPAAISADSSR